MTQVAVMFTEGGPQQIVMPSDAEACRRIDLAKNSELRMSRIYAYNLLERAYSDIFFKSMPPLVFDSHGKPRLEGGDVKISVSHTGGACAVAFSNSDVGVDVQSYDEMRGKERVLKRFVNDNLQNLIKNAKKPRVKYLFYKLCCDGIMLVSNSGASSFDEQNPPSEERIAAGAWSSLEAVLKSRGGFCEYKNAESLLRAGKLDTRYLYNAAVSVALTGCRI